MFSETILLAVLSACVLAAPLPQANKIGAGISSIATGFDDGTGYLVENAGASIGNSEEGIAALGNLPAAPASRKRQANKIGAGVSSIATGFDDGTGYLVENAGASIGNSEEGIAALGNAPTTAAARKRQANKIGAGVSSNATGFDDGTGYLVENAGASIGNAEEGIAALGNARVRRQIGNTGQGAQGLFDGIDTGAGQGSQDALNNAGTLIATEGVAAGDLVPAKRQIGNTGQGAEVLFDGIDTGAGQGSQDALNNAGTLVSTEGLATGDLVPAKSKRQIGNTGQGAQGLFDGIDTGVGQGSQDALNNAGTLIATEGVAAGNLVPA